MKGIASRSKGEVQYFRCAIYALDRIRIPDRYHDDNLLLDPNFTNGSSGSPDYFVAVFRFQAQKVERQDPWPLTASILLITKAQKWRGFDWIHGNYDFSRKFKGGVTSVTIQLEQYLADKSKLATAYGFAILILLVTGLFLAYEGTIYWQFSPSQWNEGIAGAVAVVIIMRAVQEYLHL